MMRPCGRLLANIDQARTGIVCARNAAMAETLLIDAAAARLGISRRTVYYWIREGRLRTVSTRTVSQRVTIESVEEALRTSPVRRRAAGVSGRGPSAKSPAP
jgi:excisionase family DNA binding protein